MKGFFFFASLNKADAKAFAFDADEGGGGGGGFIAPSCG
jgi:hypothetical protein